MSDSVLMPALGESVTEGTVTRWLKQVGDEVAVDEPLLEVSTDKVDTEIPSPFAGTLSEILVQEDETVEVGTPLARIGAAGEGGGSEQASQAAPAEQAPQSSEQPAQQPTDAAASADEQQAAQVPDEVTRTEAPSAPATEDEPVPAPPQPGSGGGGSGGDTQDVTMPALGESVTEGTVTRWLKQVGDEVAVDEPLLEVSTDKVDTEIPSPLAGTLVEVLVQEDETVDVGTALARIGSAAAGGGSTVAQAGGEQAGAQPAQQEQAAQQQPAQQEPQQQTPAQPEQQASQTASTPEAPAQQQSEVRPPEPSAEAKAQEQSPETAAPGQPAYEAQQVVAAPAVQGGASASSSAQAPAPSSPAPAGGSGYLTPLVRKLAAEKGVDLSSLTGTGVGGRIRKEDVLEAAARREKEEQERAERERASQQQASAPAPAASPSKPAATPSVSPLRGTTEKASRLRQIIASRMVESLQSMAQLTTVIEVDVTKVARLRARAKEDFRAREGVNLTFLPFFVLAATEALKAHPKVNGVLEGNQITYHGEENVGIAVDTERGLVVPVIRGAGDLNLAGIARKIADLAARTRDNKVTPDELSGATFTVTNTGSGGALFDTPIVPIGTSAILGTGAIVKRPVVATDPDGGEYIAVRSMCYLALSYDHRLVDGADASRYLMTVKKRIEDGDFEAEVGL
ncbi:2-oxoglutarate dehydrogenase, E2 component, dihydrolipoamide succinyltransferase [Actinotalea ferrariae]|uniref:2-oxoglutarate dehydrogenase, E2 component, dihydrolipoamide succinyltransferase n=1 Tax=Actinotalea ferrariae TaxID=1386098 RepID=UPI001C8CD58D|nr:2-oxoglutarate dehydrogenase, E2 component, dihydrolipoamide succinyltransferase [Actinotalea ferrariae]MBX9246216.1 2-oxoglutarate dehydrogenase, E2 component, dihydrolipoamide succinyltransferase [Actinotalea ferrariae]